MEISLSRIMKTVRQNAGSLQAVQLVNMFMPSVNSVERSEIEIDVEVRKLIAMALLAGMNVAIEKVEESIEAESVAGRIAGIAPQFQKIGVVSRRLGIMESAFAIKYLKGKHDFACVSENVALEYGADTLVCPFSGIDVRRIMNFCRTRTNYIVVLNKKLDSLLRSKSIEGINSIDMLIVPNGDGFVMHELKWLSRAETEQGRDIHGEDVLEMRRIGTNRNVECDPEKTKFVHKYSRIRGESVHTVWSCFA